MVRTRVGYSGGTKDHPTYHDLGDHTESVQVDFDPTKITYAALLDVFWKEHVPTARAWSQQYKAILFFHDETQKKAALESRDALEKRLGAKVTTEVRPAVTFWRAEDYHQKYALRGHLLLARELRAQADGEQAFVDSPRAAKVNAWLQGEGDLDTLTKEVDGFGLSTVAKQDLLETARRLHGAGGSCPR